MASAGVGGSEAGWAPPRGNRGTDPASNRMPPAAIGRHDRCHPARLGAVGSGSAARQPCRQIAWL